MSHTFSLARLLLVFALLTGCDVNPRKVDTQAACKENLKVIEAAKAFWAMERQKTTNDTLTEADLVAPNLLREMPRCPNGGTYRLGRVEQKPTCTIRGHSL